MANGATSFANSLIGSRRRMKRLLDGFFATHSTLTSSGSDAKHYPITATRCSCGRSLLRGKKVVGPMPLRCHRFSQGSAR
jgi:hypothetical protein